MPCLLELGPTLCPVSGYNAGARARLAFAVAGRDSADYARGLVGDVGTPQLPGERIRAARTLRLLGLSVLDRAVLIEALTGTSWAAIAEALALPESEARQRYETTVQLWSKELPAGQLDATIFGDHTTGLRHDLDPEGTAAALDAWFQRHAEPWDGADTPVTRALTGD